VATLTYNYARSSATLAPLRAEHDPGAYDLCLEHARHLQVPAGWSLERVTQEPDTNPAPAWLASLADEVRRIGWGEEPEGESVAPRRRESSVDAVDVASGARRGHLRVLADLP